MKGGGQIYVNTSIKLWRLYFPKQKTNCHTALKSITGNISHESKYDNFYSNIYNSNDNDQLTTDASSFVSRGLHTTFKERWSGSTDQLFQPSQLLWFTRQCGQQRQSTDELKMCQYNVSHGRTLCGNCALPLACHWWLSWQSQKQRSVHHGGVRSRLGSGPWGWCLVCYLESCGKKKWTETHKYSYSHIHITNSVLMCSNFWAVMI